MCGPEKEKKRVEFPPSCLFVTSFLMDGESWEVWPTGCQARAVLLEGAPSWGSLAPVEAKRGRFRDSNTCVTKKEQKIKKKLKKKRKIN